MTLLGAGLKGKDLSNRYSHVMPTLGWSLIGLNDWDGARRYFEAALTRAQSMRLLPIVLDIRAGLAVVRQLCARRDGLVQRQESGRKNAPLQ